MTAVEQLPATMRAKIILELCPVPNLPGFCWAWSKRTAKNYGALQGRLAHRVIYELLIGPVPDGMELDHACSNRPCVNPAHLEPVTHLENIARAVNRRTHCQRMHPLSGDNVMICNGGRARRCRTCYLIHAREQELRRRREVVEHGRRPRRRRRDFEAAS